MMAVHSNNRELRSQHEHYKAVRARLTAPPVRSNSGTKNQVNAAQVAVTEPSDVPSLCVLSSRGTVVARLSAPSWTHSFASVQPVTFVWYDMKNLGAAGIHRRNPIVEIDEIVQEVCSKFKVSKHEIFSDRRNKRIILARHFAMWMCRNQTLHSYPRIGRYFGRDHTTVIHACGKIDEMIADGKLNSSGELMNGGKK